MSQFGGQPSAQYGNQQNPSGYGQQDPSAYGQQDPSAYGQQDPSAYGQQDPSGYGQQNASGYGQQDPSGYGQQNPSGFGQQKPSGYGQQDQQDQEDQSKSQPGQQPILSSAKDTSANRQNAEEEHKKANGVTPKQPNEKQDQKQDEHGGEDKHSQAIIKSKHAGEMQGAPDARSGAGRKYHHTHMNALHHMGKAAANGFTPEHIDSLLHLMTYAGGTLANTHGLAPTAPVEPTD